MSTATWRIANRHSRAHIALVVSACLILYCGALRANDEVTTEGASPRAERHFRQKVRPLIAARCVACHGADKAEGGLRLDSRDAAIKGGDSGPALVPGKPEESLLLTAVKHTHDVLKMPPKDELTRRDIAALEDWIRDGAVWPSEPLSSPVPSGAIDTSVGDAWTDARNPIVQLFGGQRLDLWSFQPVARPDVPNVEHRDWIKNEIDYFVLARMEQEQVRPPEIADSRTLARRLHYDLTGLPPTPEKVAEFVAAAEQQGPESAATALIDELLTGARFGEQFARIWLDVVRYSDSNGFDWDEFRPQAWRFRDYVVRSFNADKPFDQFIREQLAGDELFDGPPRTAAEQDCLIATGFLRLGPYDNAAKLFDEQDRSRAELLADVTETTGGAFLGLTLTCCRCHDHKHDPISQVDYYRFRDFFAAMQFADDTPLDLGDQQAAIRKHNADIDAKTKPLREKLAAIPESDATVRDQLQEQIKAIESKRQAFARGLLMSDDAKNIVATHVLFQGNHKAPRDAVEAGFFSVLDPQAAVIGKSHNSHTTGRRLTLANWIASPQNPLTARVFVNRIWQSLMGRPLVATPNDFGLAGLRPTDPELLDWLADEFVRQGWSVKQLVRQIVMSAAYQQAPTFTADSVALRSPRRLTAEQIRDSLLYVSGLITAKADGPPIWPEMPAEVLNSNPAFLDDNPEKTKGWYPSPKPEQYCRSLFLVQKRNTRVPLLESFDLPDNSTPCACREVSTIAPQALMLLNSSLVADASQALAARIERDAGKEPRRQVRRAFELTLQRPPDEVELTACVELVSSRSFPELCRALVNLNEFVYEE